MPVGIAPADRKILMIGGAVLFVMLAASVVLAPSPEVFDSPVPSTYSAQSHGAEAAYLLLSRLHYPVRRWEDSPDKLDAQSGNALLILAEPSQMPSRKEREAVKKFVQDGGHLLFTGSNVTMFFPSVDISAIAPQPGWKTISPAIPSRFSRVAQRIALQPEAYWGTLQETQLPLYSNGDSPVVVSWVLGKGHIFWWAGSTPLTNAGIQREDNLPFFLATVSNWSEDQPFQIYWDEYFHGQRSSVWSYISKTSLAWGLLQLGVIAAAILFTFSRRSGPIFIPAGVSRLSPLEFVDTLGGLYERAGAASSAVSVSLLQLRARLARQLGLPANTPDAELAAAAEARLGWRNSGLAELFRQADDATRVAKLPPREALRLVQELERHTANLGVRAQLRREKT